MEKKSKMESVRKFWQNHKGKIVAAGVGIGAGVASVFIGKRIVSSYQSKRNIELTPLFEGIGESTRTFMTEGQENYVISGIADATVESLKKLNVAEAIQNLEGITDQSRIHIGIAIDKANLG